MEEKEYVYAIHEGSIHEGGNVTGIYKTPEKAIEIAQKVVEKRNERIHKVHKDYNLESYLFVGVDPDLDLFPETNLIKHWASTIEEVYIYKVEVL